MRPQTTTPTGNTNPSATTALEMETYAQRRRNGALFGVGFFIVAESIFFLGLFLAYFYMRNQALQWPPPGAGEPTLSIAIVNTAISLASGAAMWFANRAIAQDHRRGFLIGICAAAALGIIFMAVQSVEFAKLGASAKDTAYGSAFVALLVFHVVRVFAGVVLIAIVLVRALLGQFSAQRRMLVQAATMYWYFIVAVWLAVFYILYIIV
jgi:heme/copper-type cytochrome/quinol oxidase subunit 3